MKIPRPERSGVIAILAMFMLWDGYFGLARLRREPGMYSELMESPRELLWQVAAMLVPFLGWDFAEPERPAEKVEKRYDTILIYPGTYRKLAVDKGVDCPCHLDIHYFGSEIEHYRGPWFCHEMITDGPVEHNVWQRVKDFCHGRFSGSCFDVMFDLRGGKPDWIEVQIPLTAGKAEYRLHCEDRR